MINKLTIEQLERLKDLATKNQEYGIAKDLRREIFQRKNGFKGVKLLIKIESLQELEDTILNYSLNMKSYVKNIKDLTFFLSTDLTSFINEDVCTKVKSLKNGSEGWDQFNMHSGHTIIENPYLEDHHIYLEITTK